MTDKPTWAELMQELDRAIAELQESAIELELLSRPPVEATKVIAKAMEH
jgi:hypothetical protein